MNEMWFRAALFYALALIVGCSSRIELDVDREKTDTAVEVGSKVSAVSQQSRTKLRFGAENTVSDPVVSVTVETHEERMVAVAESPVTEVRRQEVVRLEEPASQVQMNVTTITLGDINIHVGDQVQIHQQTQTFQADTSPAEQPPVSVPERRSRSTSQSPRDAYHERLRWEHEMRVRRWQTLFE